MASDCSPITHIADPEVTEEKPDFVQLVAMGARERAAFEALSTGAGMNLNRIRRRRQQKQNFHLRDVVGAGYYYARTCKP
jgi:hypothetical protein